MKRLVTIGVVSFGIGAFAAGFTAYRLGSISGYSQGLREGKQRGKALALAMEKLNRAESNWVERFMIARTSDVRRTQSE